MAGRRCRLALMGTDDRVMAGAGHRSDDGYGRDPPGHRVLDVAAGAGGQTLVAAGRVGPTGQVLATDIAPAILTYAAHAAAAAGLRNVQTAVWTVNDSVPPGSFDAVISRVGLIYFPDRQPPSLACSRRCGRAGGSPPSCTPLPTATGSSPCRSG